LARHRDVPQRRRQALDELYRDQIASPPGAQETCLKIV